MCISHQPLLYYKELTFSTVIKMCEDFQKPSLSNTSGNLGLRLHQGKYINLANTAQVLTLVYYM